MRVRFLAETSLAALAVCVLSGPALAADPEPGTPPAANPDAHKTTPSERIANRFEYLDTDKSGGLDEKEFTAGRTKEAALKRAKGAFGRLDADKNGIVTPEEFSSREPKAKAAKAGKEPAAAPTKAPAAPAEG